MPPCLHCVGRKRRMGQQKGYRCCCHEITSSKGTNPARFFRKPPSTSPEQKNSVARTSARLLNSPKSSLPVSARHPPSFSFHGSVHEHEKFCTSQWTGQLAAPSSTKRHGALKHAVMRKPSNCKSRPRVIRRVCAGWRWNLPVSGRGTERQ